MGLNKNKAGWGTRLQIFFGDSESRGEPPAQQLSARGGSLECTIDGDRVKITGRARLYLHGTLEL